MAIFTAAALSSGEGKSYLNQRLIVTAKPRQTGVSQRSLTRRCRLGRATELVFITAMGAMITIGGQAAAQSITYTNGETRTATLNTTGDIDLTVNAGEATQSGVILGSGNLDKEGAGTLTLSGANTYTGTTTINAGTLRITHNNALGASAGGGTVVADGATLELSGVLDLDEYAFITLNGAGVAGRGALRSTESFNNVTGGVITLDSAARITATSNLRFTGSSIIIGNNQNLTFDGEGIITVNSRIATGSGTLTKEGTGKLSLGGNNRFTGDVFVNAGSLEAFNGAAIDDGALVQVASGASFAILTAETIGNLSGAGSVSLDANLTLGDASDRTFSGMISGSGDLNKEGAGTLTLSGANTYTGTTTINAGTLRIAHNNALGATAGGTIVADGATLELQALSGLSEAIMLNGDGVAGGGALRSVGGLSSSVNGAITLGSAARITSTGLLHFTTGSSISGANQNLTFDGGGAIDLIGTIATGSGSLTKEGTGTLSLYGNNTFTGDVFVNAGTIHALSGAAIGDAALVQVASGADFFVSVAETIGNLSGAGFVSLRADLTLGDASDRTFSGVIREFAGARNLIKRGTGTLTLSGANTYTGTTTISNGTLQVGNGGTTGSLGTGGVVNNATLRFDRSDDVTVGNVISGTGNLVKQGTGTLTLSGENTYEGTTNVNAGTLLITHDDALGSNVGGTVVADGATLELSGGVRTSEPITLNGAGVAGRGALRGGGGLNTVSGHITLGSAARITSTGLLRVTTGSSISGANQNLTFDGEGNIDIFGTIATGSGSLTKQGTGTLTLTGANTYTGTTNINAGTLRITHDDALGSNVGGTIVADGATLELSDGVDTSEPITLNGAGVAGRGALRSVGGSTNRVAGDITLGSAARITASRVLTIRGTSTIRGTGQNLTFDGDAIINVQGVIATGSGTLTKEGAGLTILYANNTFTGDVFVNAGTLELWTTGGAAIDDGALVQVASGALFRLISAETIGNLSGAGAVALGANLTLGDANDRTFSGVIGSSGRLIKQGAGTLTLSGANTYSGGTTISNGTLQVGNGGTTGTLGTGGIVNNATLRFDRSDDVDVVNVISGTGNLVKQGAGRLTLLGANTYTGTTNVDAGTLRITHDNALGSNVGGTVVADGATLELSGGVETSEPITLNGVGVAGRGALRSAGGGQ